MHRQSVAERAEPAGGTVSGAVMTGGATVAPHHETAFGPAARRLEERLAAVREARRKARRDLRELLRVPPEERVEKIFSARSRYRSRAFAELLVEEARRRVKDDPRQARQLAGLVPEVLHWIPGAEGRPWRLALEVLGRAHQANALRVAGDLVAADRVFAALRRELTAAGFDEAHAVAELASLEASLRIDQRRFAEAAELLDLAISRHRGAGSREDLARVLIKRANLARHEERYDLAEELLRSATAVLDPAEHAVLFVHAVGTRALCLCDLGRLDEAETTLDEHRERFAAEGTRWNRFLLLGLRGRIALGRGRLAVAEEAFTRIHEGALEMGRHLDAALSAVYLGQVYLEEGRHREVEELAAGLLVAFRSRGVGRETMAALRLFHEAAASSEIDRARLRQLRRMLQGAVPQHA